MALPATWLGRLGGCGGGEPGRPPPYPGPSPWPPAPPAFPFGVKSLGVLPPTSRATASGGSMSLRHQELGSQGLHWCLTAFALSGKWALHTLGCSQVPARPKAAPHDPAALAPRTLAGRSSCLPGWAAGSARSASPQSPGLCPHNAIAPNPTYPGRAAGLPSPSLPAHLPDGAGQGAAALCRPWWALCRACRAHLAGQVRAGPRPPAGRVG